MRKLCSIQTVKSVTPIDGADFIVEIEVLGWHLVAKKGEFKVGDKCIFYEIDSKLKSHAVYEFLAKDKFRVKTRRFKGVISQGLALPITILSQEGVLEDGWSYVVEKEIITSILMDVKLEDDTDLTEILGVEKYDLEEGESLQASTKFKLNPKKSKISNKIAFWKWKIKQWFKRFDTKSKGGNFPSHLCPKTNETRIQAYSQTALEDFKGKSFTITTKMDGSSLTVIKYKKDVIVCSRNLALKENINDKFWKAVLKYDLKSKLKSNRKNIALQMELVGESIQGNRYNIKGNEVRLFNVYDIDKKKYLAPKEMIEIAKKLDIPHVHIVDDNFIFNHTVDEIVALANVKSIENDKVNEEGYVFKLNDDEKKLSFKVINPLYLLEKEEKEKRNKPKEGIEKSDD